MPAHGDARCLRDWRGSGQPLQNGCGAYSVHSSAGSVQASPGYKSCHSYPRLMTQVRDVKETRSFLSAKAWMDSVGCNREKPKSLTWLPVCSKSQSLLAETIYGPSAEKGY